MFRWCRFAFLIAVILCIDSRYVHAQSTSTFLVLSDVEERVADLSSRNPRTYIVPSFLTPIYFGAIDCESFLCVCNQEGRPWDYELVQVEKENVPIIRRRLERLLTVPLYGRYELNTWEGTDVIRFRLTRRIPVGSTEAPIILPTPELQEFFASRVVTEVWVEGGVRTDINGIPLEQPEEGVIPIAVETLDSLYLIKATHVEERVYGCMLYVTFGSTVFAFEGSADRSTVVSEFLQKLQRGFMEAPFSTVQVSDMALPPGELWFRRAYKSSEVMGPPYFELSTFVVKWWSTEDTQLWGIDSAARQVAETDYYFSVSIDHSLLRSVGVNGSYAEPSYSHLEKYKEAVAHLVRATQQSICARFQGRLESAERESRAFDRICIIGG